MDATGSFVSACEQHRQESARYECAVRSVDRPTTEHRAPIDQPPNAVHRTWIFMSAQIHEPTPTTIALSRLSSMRHAWVFFNCYFQFKPVAEDCGVVATVLKAA